MGLDVRRPVGERGRSPSRDTCICGLVGTSGSGEETRCWDSWRWQHPVFPDLGSERKTDTGLSYKVRISVLLLTKLDGRPWFGSMTTVRFLDTPSPCLGLGAPCSRKQRSRPCLCQLPGDCCQPSLLSLGASGGGGGGRGGPPDLLPAAGCWLCPGVTGALTQERRAREGSPISQPSSFPQPPYQRSQPPSP